MTELSQGLLPPIITQTRGIRIQDKETIERELEFSSMTPISHLHLLAWIQPDTTATFGIGKKFHLSAMTPKPQGYLRVQGGQQEQIMWLLESERVSQRYSPFLA